MAVKQIDREAEVVFTNFTDEVFIGKWAKKLYELRPGKSCYAPFYLAEHFGRHLVDREIHKMAATRRKELLEKTPNVHPKELDAEHQRVIANTGLRQKLMDRCVENQEPTESNVGFVRLREVQRKERAPLKTEERAADQIANKGVPADQFEHVKPRKAEAEFEGLNETSQPAGEGK